MKMGYFNLATAKMTLCLDPLGMPLATDVVSGERADDGLYAPIISRISDMLQKKGVLYVGDCKLSSFDNRLHIKGKVKGHYLCPLPNTGRTSEEMEAWIAQGNLKDEKDELIKYVVETDQGEQELKAKGYEKEREQSAQIEGREIKWKERVLIVKSAAHEKQKKKGLERRLSNSEKKLNTLTPPRGPGKRQITDEAKLIESAQAILKKHRVEDFLTYEYVKEDEYVKEVERETKYVGRGRGSANRERKVTEKIRYQITKVERNEEKIAAQIKKYGWKAYVTDVPKERLGFIDVVQSYRKQYRVERIFNRLKSRLNIAPLYVKKKVGVRVYTLIEFVVRRSLQRSNEKLVGLHLENPKKATDIPTCERLLKAFSKITLTIIKVGDSDLQHLTPLSKLQTDILNHLGFDSSIYKNLEKLQI
jgi:transposase